MKDKLIESNHEQSPAIQKRHDELMKRYSHHFKLTGACHPSDVSFFKCTNIVCTPPLCWGGSDFLSPNFPGGTKKYSTFRWGYLVMVGVSYFRWDLELYTCTMSISSLDFDLFFFSEKSFSGDL